MIVNRIDLMKEINQAIAIMDSQLPEFGQKQAMREINLDLGLCRDMGLFGTMYKAVEAKMEEVEDLESPSDLDCNIEDCPELSGSPIEIEAVEEVISEEAVKMKTAEVVAVEENVEIKTAEDSTVAPLDVMKALLKGVKNTSIVEKIFTKVLLERPEQFSGWKAIADAAYLEAGIDKKVSSGYLVNTINRKFIGNGLLEWNGSTKSPIFWR